MMAIARDGETVPAWMHGGFADFDAFESIALAAGYDSAVVRPWGAHTVADTHAHPFDADALVTDGEMWLTCGGVTRHLQPGDTFSLPRGTPHAERYGAQGAIYWVARRTRSPGRT